MRVKKQGQQFLIWGFILSTLLYAGISWYRIITTSAPDFNVYYGSARLITEHKPLFGNTGLFTAFNYPPVTLLLFLPFLVLPYNFAQGLWISVSIVLIPVCVGVCLKIKEEGMGGGEGSEGIDVRKILLWSAVWFWTFPSKFTLGMGQINIVSICFLLVGILLFDKKRVFLSSMVFSLLLVSKPQFLLVLPFLMFSGYWYIAIVAGLLYGVESLLVSVIFGFSYFYSYINNQMPEFLSFSGRDIYFNQSISGFFSRIFFIPIAQWCTRIATGLIGGVGGIEVVIRRLQKKTIKLHQLMYLFLPILVLVEPLGWQHHYVFLLPVYIWMWYEDLQIVERIVLVVSFILVSINITTPVLYNSSIFYKTFLLSHDFWGAILLLGLGMRRFWGESPL